MNTIDLDREAVSDVLPNLFKQEQLEEMTNAAQFPQATLSAECHVLLDGLVAAPSSTGSIRRKLMQNKEFYDENSTPFDPAIQAYHDISIIHRIERAFWIDMTFIISRIQEPTLIHNNKYRGQNPNDCLPNHVVEREVRRGWMMVYICQKMIALEAR